MTNPRITPDNGVIDEITAAACSLHIEQMDEHNYHMNVTTPSGTVAFCITGSIKEVWRDGK